MNIFWHGQSCFQIISSSGKDKQVSVVTDPLAENTGLRIPKIEADILLVSNSKNESISKLQGKSFLIESPGEYEIKEVFVQGIPSVCESDSGKEKGTNTIYTIEAEGIKICHLGNFSQKELTSEQVEEIGEIDILMIPVGGGSTISSKEAVKVMSQIEPSIIIPMQYQIPKLKIKLDGVDKFLKTMGLKNVEPLPKLSIKKKDILPEEAKIIILKN
jgi:L-ascorbate metabolism protein UlaG (beta-lactamase superfamily)